MMKSRKKVRLAILLVVGTAILLNFLSDRFFLRLDFTEDKRFTLSDATKDILKELEEPVTIKAYFSGNLPPQLEQIKRDFRDMLNEYASYSKGMVVYEFIDPLKDEKLKNEATQAGVQQIQIQVQEKDQVKAQVAFMGASIQLGEENEALPIIQDISGLEYELSSNIKKLSVKDKPAIGFVQGHGEPNLGKIWQVKQGLDIQYQTELVYLNDSIANLDKYKTLIIIGPTDSVNNYELEKLDAFINKGGRLFIAMKRVGADLNKGAYTSSVNTGLETWLFKKGIAVNNNLVIDKNCLKIGVQVQQGFFMPVSFPYFLKVNNFQDHPASKGLEEIYFQFASTIDFSGDSSLHFTPLIFSSENSGTMPADGYLDVMHEWSDNDFPVSKLTLAAAIEGRFNGSVETKIVVIGNGDFPVSTEQQQQVNPDNINLLVNSIDWLTDDTGLVQLRTKGATARPIDDLDDSKKTFLKYLNFILPVLLILIFGIFRYQKNRIVRTKRMEEGYV
jgi:gliding-associated putative ABC transporter substrate-binding component GldG